MIEGWLHETSQRALSARGSGTLLALAAVLLLGSCSRPTAPAVPPRTGAGTVTLLIWGDQRPSCSTGEYPPMVGQVLQRVALEAPRADLLVATGDYLCAWAHQGDRAFAQLETFLRWIPEAQHLRTVYASGNHEVTQAQMLRSSIMGVTPKGWRQVQDVRVVWLPSDQDLAGGLTPGWLGRARSWRLVVVRHEPWGAVGTKGDEWIRDRVRAARPTLVLHGHVHTWAAPLTHVADVVPLDLGPAEVIAGNGGAKGWEKSVGWAGVTVAELRSDGTTLLRGLDTEGIERVRAVMQ